MAVAADGSGCANGGDAGIQNDHASLLIKLAAVGAVRGFDGRLDRGYVGTPEQHPCSAVVLTVQTVILEDAVFISRAGEARVLESRCSGRGRSCDQLLAGGPFIRSAARECTE